MSRTKEILISLLAIIVLILAITTNVFATSGSDIENLLGNKQNNNEVAEIQTRNNTTNNVVNNTTNKATNNTVNNIKANVANATEHADAGVDYSIVLIIAVCGISAIYAYKKIRDYNV